MPFIITVIGRTVLCMHALLEADIIVLEVYFLVVSCKIHSKGFSLFYKQVMCNKGTRVMRFTKNNGKAYD